MSIIIHFNTASFIPSSVTLPSARSCISRARTKLAMVPGIDQADRTVMTDDESSMVDIATSNTLYTHTVNDLKNSSHVLGSCFGLPYQDHNYGAPPPPTPPSYSPCASPAHANGVPDEDTNLSVVSTDTTNEETQECSITRCICGFEHDDEYMICCDLCLVWQHVDCMGLDRNNIPETYLCEKCEPRKVDRHKAKVLQARKKVAMTDSSDSDEDIETKNSERKQKNRSRRKRKEEDKIEKLEQGSAKKSRLMHKHSKERLEAKRSKLRRTKNKESTSTADEEAQDAWEISLEWCEKNFETALNNQYTPEVQHLARTLPLQGHERKFMELLLTRHCQVLDGNQKRLISIYDIPRDQPLIEYVGKFLLASQFYELHPAFSRRLFPFVTFYSLDQEEICVDASVYGNEARFVRRSCKPNAELRHLVHNGNLHLYISSTKAVFKDDEITLPLDFTLKDSIKDIECACESEECILKFHQKNGSADISQDKRKKGRKLIFSADEDSSHSFACVNTSPSKSKLGRSTSQTSEQTDGKSDHETDEQANERKKKTREERKIDAIMRAFDQMEKAEKRRQQALERQKAHNPKLEESLEKSEPIPVVKEEEKIATVTNSETLCVEEEKVHIPTLKPKKGKRRKGSGTASRRRTRTNSGGSEILSLEEKVQIKAEPTVSFEAISTSEANVETSTVTTTCCTTISTSTSISAALATSPVVLKTKRFLLHEWLQEKSETNTNPSATSPVSIRTEVKWNTAASSTCYVQCTKDNPHSSGISAAHLRRSSTSGSIKSYPLKACSEQGSAKKRWLRQAMYDTSYDDDPLTIDPGGMEGLHFDNGCFSPSSHGEMGSPGAVDDTITPLKKRRLMRESVESISSPLSPTVHNSESFSNAVMSLVNIEIKTETGLDDSQQSTSIDQVDSSSANLSPKTTEDKLCKSNGLKTEYIESPKKIDIKVEKDSTDTSICASLSRECTVETSDTTVSSNCKDVESSGQTNCDLEKKTCDNIKSECVQGNDLDLLQNSVEISRVFNSNSDKLSVQPCTDKIIQSNLQTHNVACLPEKLVQIIPCDSTTECNSAKRKITFSDEQCKPSSSNISEDSFSNSSRSNSPEMKSVASTMTSEIGVEHFPLKSQISSDENVHKILSDNSSILHVNNESTKNNFSDSVSLCPQLQSLISPVKNVNVSVSVSLDFKNEQNISVNIPKKILTDFSISVPEALCCNSVSSDDHINSNHVQPEEFSDLDSKSSHLSSENASLAVKATCASVTQKRKVSLSEYRMRMKDGTSKRSHSENIKRSTSSPALSATAIPETLPEQVTLAPLPLFDKAVSSQSCPTQATVKEPKRKKEAVKCDEESCSDIIEYRENLTERLKREFGFDDDSDGCNSTSSQSKSISSSSSTLCAQPPPPPPPPPPRPTRPLQSCSSTPASSVSQFGFSIATPYARPSYIVPQLPSAQFIPVQQTITPPVMPSIHTIPTPGAQCSVRPSLLPTPHSFAPSLPGAVLQPPIQHEYASVNAQNFAALVNQRPPPPPPPKSFPHVFQPGLYK